MKDLNWKRKVFSLLLAAALGMGTLSACNNQPATTTAGNKETTNAEVKTTTAKPEESKKESSGQRKQVQFWYLWGGDEGKMIEEIITAYNKSQDKFQVVGTSTPDQKAIITAISGG